MANKCPTNGLKTINNPADSGTCIFDCSEFQAGWELQIRNGVPACVYTAQPSVYFQLATAPALTDKELRNWGANTPEFGAIFTKYMEAGQTSKKRFDLAKSKISTKQQIDDAFKDLQAAENVRDTSPEAYQDARIRYYTMVKGEDWVEEEKKRVMQSEAAPKVASYMASYQDMTTRQSQQQRTMDVVKAVKDKVVSMKDDFKMTTNVFSKQINELKSQIEIEKKKSLQEKQETASWIHLLVNVLLVVFGIAAVLVLIRKLATNKPTSAYTPTPGFR